MASEDAVGKRIRDCRESQKLSQAELARLLGLSSAAIWNWETQGRVPRPKTLSKVAEILNVSEEYLAEGRGTRRPSAPPPKVTKVRSPPMDELVATESIANEIEKIRAKIAKLTGFDVSKIKFEFTVID